MPGNRRLEFGWSYLSKKSGAVHIVPYMLDGSILSASAAPIFQTILFSFPVSFVGLMVFLSLPILARLAILAIRADYVLQRWTSAKTETARKIERQRQSLRLYLERNLLRARPWPLGSSVPPANIPDEFTPRGIWNKVQHSIGGYRKRVETKLKNTVRSLYLIFAFLLSVLLIWCEVKYQASEVLQGHADIGISTEPPMKETTFARVGDWGGYLFLSNISSPANATKDCYPVTGWWAHVSHAVLDRGRFLLSTQGNVVSSRNIKDVMAISKSSVVCMAPAGEFSSICPEFVRPTNGNGKEPESQPGIYIRHSNNGKWREILYERPGLKTDWKVIEEFAEKAHCKETEETIVSGPILFNRNESKNIADKLFFEFVLGQLKKLKGRNVKVFGLASPDGAVHHNNKLSLGRAQTVTKLIQNEWRKKEVSIKTSHVGEAHLTQGITDSRSVRVVACISPE